jgi:hypothetical protein
VTDHDPFDTGAQDVNRQESDKRVILAAKQEAADLDWLMSSRRGRRIVWGLLARSGVFRLSFNTNSMTMAFNEGVKNEGLRLMGLLHTVCPEQYVQMTKESKQ